MGGDEYLELLVENKGAQHSAANVLSRNLVKDNLTVELRLEKKGSKYTAWYSTDGKDFKLLGYTDIVLSNIKAGLIVFDGGQAPANDMVAQMMGINAGDAENPFKVRFNYFHIMNMGN